MKVACLSFAFALICSTALAAVSESFSQRLPFSPTHTFTLENINGKVVVETWDQPEVLIEGVKHGQNETDLGRIEVRVESSPKGVAVKTKHQRRWWMLRSGNPRVDYRVKIPSKGNELHLKSVNGQIRVSRFVGEIEADTVNGGIQVSDTIGGIRASTVNGGISLNLLQLQGDECISAKTVNGGCTISLPEDAGFQLDARVVNGRISSDFSASFTEGSRKHRHIRVGEGGPKITAETVNGSLIIRSR